MGGREGSDRHRERATLREPAFEAPKGRNGIAMATLGV